MGYLGLADAVNAVSQACAVSVERFVEHRRLHVIHNGVPLEMAESKSGDRSSIRELGLPDDAFVILSVSHLCERKGQAHAIAAMPAIVEKVPSAHLGLLGSLDRDPTYAGGLRSQIRSLGLAGKVHLLGFKQDVESLLSGADLFVHTAIADPHPRSVIEAMAASLPVVAFAVDGVAETVVSGETGRLIAPEDVASLANAVIYLARDSADRLRLGRAGRQRVVEHFTDIATADKVDDVIRSVLEERGKQDTVRASVGAAMQTLHRRLPRRTVEWRDA